MSSEPLNNRKRIVNALNGRPLVKLTEANIRDGLAALISQLAIKLGTRATAPEIQALFDGIERVRTGQPTDPKITATGARARQAQSHARGGGTA